VLPGRDVERDPGVVECLVCRELAGEVELPGGLLVDDELVVAFHIPPQEEGGTHYLGHLLVVTRRHVDQLPDLTAEEAAAAMDVARRLAQALRAVRSPERIHLAVVGLGVPHFHLHVFPRYPGTPDDVSWMAADEWEGAPHGDAEAIAAVARELRSAIPPSPARASPRPSPS
jgi:diadenosine tetraphosphate (Ap4A) HIT family hydrolase